jgi:hypothetical protein
VSYFQGLHATLNAALAASLRTLSLLLELICFFLLPI